MQAFPTQHSASAGLQRKGELSEQIDKSSDQTTRGHAGLLNGTIVAASLIGLAISGSVRSATRTADSRVPMPSRHRDFVRTALIPHAGYRTTPLRPAHGARGVENPFGELPRSRMRDRLAAAYVQGLGLKAVAVFSEGFSNSRFGGPRATEEPRHADRSK